MVAFRKSAEKPIFDHLDLLGFLRDSCCAYYPPRHAGKRLRHKRHHIESMHEMSAL